jgi:ADP-ribose pyrophosphatase YjhB (NUDIX family)
MNDRWKPNVTVAAVIEKNGEYLLVEEQTPLGLQLNNPAGHLELGESLIQACIREVLEETGYHFIPTFLVGIYLSQSNSQGITYLRFAFSGVLGQHDEQIAVDQGIVRNLWLTPQQIQESQQRHRSALVLKCIEDHRLGQRFSLDVLQDDLGRFIN